MHSSLLRSSTTSRRLLRRSGTGLAIGVLATSGAPVPLYVLSHGIPFGSPFPGWPAETMEGIMTDLQNAEAALVSDAKHVIATESGHNIHQDQPELVIAAIRAVVDAVRNPATWTS